MLPSQLKRLINTVAGSIETLRSELRGIKEATDEQKAAITKASEASEKKWAEVGSIIARAINTSSDSVPDYEKSQRQKEHNLQWGIFWVTLFGAIAAAAAAAGAFYYAGIAKDQLTKMDETYREMQKQTPEIKKSADAAKIAAEAAQQQAGLTKDQLVGTQAAALSLELWLDESTRQVGAVLQNIGNNARARDIHLTWSVARVSLSTGQQIGKALTFTPRIDPIRGTGPTTTGWEKRIDLPWPLPSIPAQSENEVPTNWPGEMGIKLFGTLSYDNGFGDRYNPEPFCKIWLPHWRVKLAERQYSEGGGLIRCDVLHATIRNNLAELDKIKKAKQ